MLLCFLSLILLERVPAEGRDRPTLPDPDDRPRQRVDRATRKPSITDEGARKTWGNTMNPEVTVGD